MGASMSALGWLGNLGWAELAIIFLVVLLFFGAARLPGLARSLGRSIHEFRKGLGAEEKDARGQSHTLL